MTHDNDIFSNDDEEIIWVSKNELKRDAEALKDLGLELTRLAPHILDRLPLDETLRDAINLAKRINREGRRRQLQLIGKLLRARDAAPITEALDLLKNHDNKQTLILQKLEKWRDKLVEEGDEALTVFMQTYPNADRQHLRTLIRQAKKEKTENKTPEDNASANKQLKAHRQIFDYLRGLETVFKK